MTHITERQARQLNISSSPQRQTGKPPAVPGLKESDIQKQIKDFLQWSGFFVFKNHQSLGSYKGIADLYALRAGRSVWIEIKTPAGSQSEDQITFQADIEAHGGEYIVARCVEDVEYLGRGIIWKG
jgi:hypothetical protein